MLCALKANASAYPSKKKKTRRNVNISFKLHTPVPNNPTPLTPNHPSLPNLLPDLLNLPPRAVGVRVVEVLHPALDGNRA